MKKIVVDAFEDPSRPQGGHAVLLLRGLTEMPARPSIRLRPVEAGVAGDARGLWRGGRIEPIATRATSQGIELVVGPDIVGHPQLLAGMPVIVEVPEADVRGEFLWPSVAPLAQPRRRHVVVPRHPRHLAPVPAPARDTPPEGLDALEPDDLRTAGAAQEHGNGAVMVTTAGNLAIRSDITLDAAGTQPARAAGATPQPPTPDTGRTTLGVAASETTDARPGSAAATARDTDGPSASIGDAPTSAPLMPASLEAEPAGTLQSRLSDPELPVWTPGEASLARRRRNRNIALGLLAVAAAAYAWQSRKPVVTATGHGDKVAIPSALPPAGPSDKPGGSDAKTAAAAPAGLATKPAAPACAAPVIETEALPAGRMRVAIKAPCRSGEEVRLTYAGAETLLRLDGSGSAAWVLDAFAGESEPLQARFADGASQSVAVKGLDFERLSKVAVIWRAPVDLDLHAFEYAALPGTKGHVWAKAAGSAEAARSAVGGDRRGHGFVSTTSDGRGDGDRLEVYTFLHADEQTGGTVGLAIDHATRGAEPDEATCGKGPLAEVAYTLVVLARGQPVRREGGLIAAAPCGKLLAPEVRFNQSALPTLKIRK